MKITIPFKTPTINHLYGQHGVRKYLKPEAKELRERIKEIIEFEKDNGLFFSNANKLQVNIKIYENWYTKKGKVKRKDISNREKFLVDSVFDALGIDDKGIFKHTMEKIQSNEEKAEITINGF